MHALSGSMATPLGSLDFVPSVLDFPRLPPLTDVIVFVLSGILAALLLRHTSPKQSVHGRQGDTVLDVAQRKETVSIFSSGLTTSTR